MPNHGSIRLLRISPNKEGGTEEMPIGGQLQRRAHAPLSGRQIGLLGGWKTEQERRHFALEIVITFGESLLREFPEPSERIQRFEHLRVWQTEGGPAVAQVWNVGEFEGHWFPTLLSKRILGSLLPSHFLGTLFEESLRLMHFEPYLLEGPETLQLQITPGVESYGNILLSGETCSVFDAFEPESYLVAEKPERSTVPVFLAEAEAIRAMSQAQEEEEARAQSEIEGSYVNPRLIHDEIDE